MSNRRGFIKMAGAGTVAAGVAAGSGIALAGPASAAAAPSTATLAELAAGGAVVAFVSDPSSGTVSVMTGSHEVSVVDHDLAARLLRAARVGSAAKAD